MFPDLDYPDLLWEFFGPWDKSRPVKKENDSTQATEYEADMSRQMNEYASLSETCDELCSSMYLTL